MARVPYMPIADATLLTAGRDAVVLTRAQLAAVVERLDFGEVDGEVPTLEMTLRSAALPVLGGVAGRAFQVRRVLRIVRADIDPPPAPVLAPPTAGDSQLTTEWTASLGADGYSVRLYATEAAARADTGADGAAALFSAETATLSHVFTGLANGTDYWVRVFAYIEYTETVELWRVDSLTESATGGPDPVVRLRPLWMDLAQRVARFVSGGTSDLTVTLTGRTIGDALDVALDPATGAPALSSGAPMYVTGDVDAALVERRTDVQITAGRVLDLVEAITEGADCGYRMRVVAGVDVSGDPAPTLDTYAVDLTLPEPLGVPVATIGNRSLAGGGQTDLVGFPGSARPNTDGLTRSEDARDLFTALAPLGSDPAGPGVGAAIWRIGDAGHDGGTGPTGGLTTLDLLVPEATATVLAGGLPVGPVPASGSFGPTGGSDGPAHLGHVLEVLTEDGQYAARYRVASSVAPAQLVVEGNAVAASGSPCRLLDPATPLVPSDPDDPAADARPLVAIEHGPLVAAYGHVESVQLTTIPPYPCLLAEAGVSTDFSTWVGTPGMSGYRPQGIRTSTAYGDVVLERVTEVGLVAHGTASMRATMPAHFLADVVVLSPFKGDGTTALYRPEYGLEGLAVWIALRVESGAVDLYLGDIVNPVAIARVEQTVGGVIADTFDVRTIVVDRAAILRAWSTGDVDGNPDDDLQLFIRNASDTEPAVVVVDAVAVVPATPAEAQPFAPLAGPRGLWLAASRALLAQANAGVESWESDLFDLYALGVPGQEPVRPGATVRVEPDGLPGGLARVVEGRWAEVVPVALGGGEAPVDVAVRLGRPRLPLPKQITGKTFEHMGGSAWDAGAPKPPEPPPAPALSGVSDGPRAIDWSWTASAGATQYELQVGAVSGGPYATATVAVGAPTTSAEVAGLEPSQTYYGRVRALDTVLNLVGPWSAVVAVLTGDPPAAPPAPVLAALTPGGGMLQASWAAASGATGYSARVYATEAAALADTGADGGAALSSAETPTLSHTFTGLVNGTSYWVRVFSLTDY